MAIIGSGISGAYAAWKLRDQGLRVHVYEMSDDVGGMFQTLHISEIPDMALDVGVMSYSPKVLPAHRASTSNQLIHGYNLNN